MPIDTDPFAASHPGSDEALAIRQSLEAVEAGVQGIGSIVTSGSPLTINANAFGDSFLYWLPWSGAGTAIVTLAADVPIRKCFMATRLGAGNVSVNATNVLTGTVATTTQYDTLVLISLGDGNWVRIQKA